MHPPPFLPSHHLSDWPECRIELICCKGTTLVPVKLLMKNHGDRIFEDVVRRLRCSRCRGYPKRVYLCAGYREFVGGAPADWAIELVSSRLPFDSPR
jgi:hypothetical protein